ncbi:MAG: FAD:protein FMN transferase [Bacilli bacterium]|nr:FAD:protein FMN transferase [Bacilli bacterium]
MKKIIIVFSLVLLIVITGCTSNRKNFYRLDLGNSFNTISEIQIVDELKVIPVSKILKLQEDSKEILVSLDKLFNVQERDNFSYLTDLKKVNNNAGVSPVIVDSEVYDLVKYAHSISLLEGYENIFDISIGALISLWDLNSKLYIESENNLYEIPSEIDISNALVKTDESKVIFNDIDKSIFLEDSDMRLDLGAVVKGYAAEKIKDYLVSEGIVSAVVNVGRNILLIGLNKGEEWNVKIQTPFVDIGQTGYYFGSIKTSDLALVTSGVYEKYMMGLDNKIYHHLLNPKTGYPFDNGLLAVSIISSDSTYADIMSTFVFGLGLIDGINYVEEDELLEAIFVYDNGTEKEIYVSSGLIDKFVFNEEVSSINYIYKGLMNYE